MAISILELILTEMAFSLTKQGRFESLEALIRWVEPAAKELKVRCEVDRSEAEWPTITLYLTKPKGQVRIREHRNQIGIAPMRYAKILPFREIYDTDFTRRSSRDRGMVKVRQVLRRAPEAAAAAG